MSEQVVRPEPASAELAERARTVHNSRADRVASQAGYWSLEITGVVVVGGGGAVLAHPALLPVAGVLLAARITAAHVARRRALRGRCDRQEQARADLAAQRAAEDQAANSSGEGVA